MSVARIAAVESLENRQLLTVIEWGGNIDGDWNNAANWSPTFVPGVNDDVIIDADDGVPYQIDLNVNASVRSLQIDSPDVTFNISTRTLTLSQDSQLGEGLIQLDSGKIAGSGTLTSAGTITATGSGSSITTPLIHNGVLQLGTAASQNRAQLTTSSVTNSGTIQIIGGAVETASSRWDVNAGQTLLNTATGKIEVPDSVGAADLRATITNEGLLDVDGVLHLDGGTRTVTNRGEINIDASGDLLIGDTGALIFVQESGTFVVDGSVRTDNDTFEFRGGVIGGANLLTLSGGTLTFDPAAGPVDLVLNDFVSITSDIGVGQTVRVQNVGNANAQLSSSSDFVNSGTIILEASPEGATGESRIRANSRKITNSATGRIDVAHEGTITATTLVNQGTLEFDEQTSLFLTTLDNQGSTIVDSDLAFATTGLTFLNSGDVIVEAGASFALTSPSSTFEQNAGTLQAAGLFRTRGLFGFNGGDLSGQPVVVDSGDLAYGVGELNPETIAVQGTTEIESNIPVNQTVIVQATDIRATLRAVDGFTNNGTLRFDREADSALTSNLLVGSGAGSFINEAAGTIEFRDGAVTPFAFRNFTNHGDLNVFTDSTTSQSFGQWTNHGNINVSQGSSLSLTSTELLHQGGSLNIDGLLESRELLNADGGAFAGDGKILVSTGDLGLNAADQGFDISLQGNVSVNGDLAAGQTLRAEILGALTISVQPDFVNSGTIRFDALDGSVAGVSFNSFGNAITNAAGGIIDVNPGGAFSLNVAGLQNAGLFELGRDLTTAGSAVVRNEGQFTIEQNATLVLPSTTSASATFIHSAGNLNVDGELLLQGGEFDFDGGTLTGNNAPTFRGGTLTIAEDNTSPAIFNVTSSSEIDSDLNANQQVNVIPGAAQVTFTVPSQFSNRGKIVLDNSGTGAGTGVLRSVNSTDGVIDNAGVIDAVSGTHAISTGTLNNTGTVNVLTDLDLQNRVIINNTGQFHVDAAGSVVVGSVANQSTPIFRQLNGGNLVVDGSFVSNNFGTFEFDGGTISGDQPVILNNSILNITDGNDQAARFRFENGSGNQLNANLAAGQQVEIATTANGGSVTVRTSDAFVNAGSIVFDDRPSPGANLKLDTQTLAGVVTNELTGSIRGTGEVEAGLLVNRGRLSPGNSPGSLTVDATLQLESSSVVDIELGGITAGTEFDRLVVEHDVTLDGEIAVSVIGAFAPTAGQTFDVITFASSQGAFDTLSGIDLGNGSVLEKTQNATDVTLNVVAPPGLTINDVAVTEGDNGTLNAVFTVQLEPTSNPVTVQFATEAQTARAGEDFVSSSGTLEFAANETQKTITVPIVGDLRNEDEETFRVLLSDAVNATIPDSEGISTITDGDPEPEIAFATADTDVNEGDGSVAVTVQLNEASGVATSINFSVSGGTATVSGNGADFVLVNGTLNFAPDETTKTFNVAINEDSLVEGPETIEITLSDSSRATVGNPASHTITITDNDFHPDLLVASSNSPDRATRGSGIGVEWVVQNVGQGTAIDSYSDRVFFSLDAILDAGDTILASRSSFSDLPLAPNETYTGGLNVTLPEVDPGNYFLIFETDSNDQITEDSDANNTLAEPIELLAADLVVSAATTPATASAGNSITVDFTTTNQGSGDANRSPLNRIFFSTDNTLDVNDALLFSQAGSQLDAGTSVVQTDNGLTIPTVAPGQYFLIFSVDTTDAQFETDETNNQLAQPIVVLTPDLTISAATAPASVVIGEEFDVSFDVRNDGDGPTIRNRVDRVYLSTDQTVDATDLVLLAESSSQNSPAVGEVASITEQVRIPNQFVAGDYFLLFQTDDSGLEFESDETNNLLSQPIRIDGADLIIESITAPANAQYGDVIDISWTVRNTGTLTIADSSVLDSFHIAASPTAASIFNLLVDNSEDQLPLGPGEAYTQTATVQLPLRTTDAPGQFFIVGRTDAGSQVTEQREDNNTLNRAIDLSLPPLPDLVVTDISIPITAAQTEDQIEVEWTVTNNGTADAIGPWNTALTLVDGDDTIGGSSLTTVNFNGTLAPGESLVRRQLVRIPQSTGFNGLARIVVTVDSTGTVFEHDGDANNRAVDNDTFDLSVRAFPNLIVSNITVPATAVGGEETAIEVTVTNTGNAPTSSPVWIDNLFLSLDQIFNPDLGEGRGSDTFLGAAQNLRFLNPGESYTSSIDVILPRGLDDEFFVFASTDITGRVRENDAEDDNRAISTPLRITLPPIADLQVTNIQTVPSIFSEQEFIVTWTVTNNGNAPTESDRVTDQILLSADDSLGPTDISLGVQAHVGILEPGQSYTESRTVTSPVGFQGLGVNVLVRTDIQDQIFEHVDETNNVSSRPVNAFLSAFPDLVIDDIQFSATHRSGTPFEVSYTGRNQGLDVTNATNWGDRVYLSEDNVLDENDRILSQRGHFGAVDVNATYDETRSITIEDSLEGEFFVIVEADFDNVVFESIFSNNNVLVSSSTVTFESRPADLVITNISAPATAEAGELLTIEWTIENQGIGSIIRGWTDRLTAQAADGSFAGRINRSFNIPETLQPGESITISRLVQMPLGFNGSLDLFIEANQNGQVFESNRDNNTSAVATVEVREESPDLQITSITRTSEDPENGIFRRGDVLSLEWTGQNLSAAQTNGVWRDAVYLSTDGILDDDDVLLKRVFRSGTVGEDETYTLSTNITLPNIGGTFRILVVADEQEDLTEINENNNTRILVERFDDPEDENEEPAQIEVDTFTFVATPPEELDNLAVENINAPLTANSGQLVSIDYSVRNVGNSIDAGEVWFDTFFLSLDQVLDSGDIALKTQSQTGPLATNALRNETVLAQLPSGLSGQFFVFVNLNQGTSGSLNEEDFTNNIAIDPEPLLIELLPPSDLVVGTIPVPTNAIPGQDISITYTVTNEGVDTARGLWSDTLFISTDNIFDSNDLPIGEVLHIGDVAPGQSYTETLTAPLPGIEPGEHFVIVRSDIRNQIPEISEANNIRASLDRVDIDVPALVLDEASTGQLGDGEFSYFRVDVPAGRTLNLNLDSNSNSAFNQLFVKFGSIPTRADFDFTANDDLGPDQELLVPVTRQGTYFILANGASVDSAGRPAFTIEASLLEFGVTAAEVTQGANKGRVTIPLRGAEFTPTTVASLVANDGTEIVAEEFRWVDQSEVWATFDVTDVALGDYGIRVVDGAASAVLEDSFTVTNGPIGELGLNVRSPAAIGGGVANRDPEFLIQVEYGNVGETDILSPIVALEALGAQLQLPGLDGTFSQSFQFLAVNRPDDGPAGILQPGASNTITFRVVVGGPGGSAADGGGNLLTFRATETEFTSEELIDPFLETFVPNELERDVLRRRLLASVGSSPEEITRALSENATHLSQLGLNEDDLIELLTFELAQQDFGYGLISPIAENDVAAPSSGPSLLLDRIFDRQAALVHQSSIFGTGWTHTWDWSANVDSDGTLIVSSPEGESVFVPNDDGTFTGTSNDFSTVEVVSSRFIHTDESGNRREFEFDGQLVRLEDRNGNRIDLTYTGLQLDSIQQVGGSSLQFAYNDAGLVSQLIDHSGRTTDYVYSNGRLIEVTSSFGTTRYEYETTSGSLSEGFVTRVTSRTGIMRAFEYDETGRIAAEEVGATTRARTEFEYDSSGMVTITDSLGQENQLLLHANGAIGQSYDALGNVISFIAGAEGRVNELRLPGGLSVNLETNDLGQITAVTDSEGNTRLLEYDEFGNAISGRDADGRTTSLVYDNNGNVISVLLPDGTQQTGTYDENGNLTSLANAANQQRTVTYDEFGRVNSVTLSDGEVVAYTYDARGNLLTVTDAAGTVTQTWNDADRQTSITYPDGRSLQFTYDTFGRRIATTDRTGFETRYEYDDLNRLTAVKDGTGAAIVEYAYDALDQLLREDHANGKFTTYSFDALGRMLSRINHASDGSVSSSFVYEWDEFGRQASQTTQSGRFEYAYDTIGQIVQIVKPDGGIIQYEYDRAGNRTAEIENGIRTDYVLDEAGRAIQIGNLTNNYDIKGFLTEVIDDGDITTYDYDLRGRLIRLTGEGRVIEYEYDALGHRIAEVIDGIRSELLNDPFGAGTLIGEFDTTGSSTARYTYGKGLVSAVNAAGAQSFYEFDGLGNTAAVTNADGLATATYEYLPFGELLEFQEIEPNEFEFAGERGGQTPITNTSVIGTEPYRGNENVFGAASNNLLDPRLLEQANRLALAGNNPNGAATVDGREAAAELAQGRPVARGPNRVEFDRRNPQFRPTPVIEILIPELDTPVEDSAGTDDSSPAASGESLNVEKANSNFEALAILENALQPVTARRTWTRSIRPQTPPRSDSPVRPQPQQSPAGPTFADQAFGNADEIEKIHEVFGGLDITNGGAVAESQTVQLQSRDPNDIQGPLGFGDEHWVPAVERLPILVRFENVADASAPAQRVLIQSDIDRDIELRTIRLGDFGFGDFIFDIDENTSTTIDQTFDFSQEKGFLVNVAAAIDARSNSITWLLTALDPTTGLRPSDPTVGFLPPNNENGDGEGFVTYSIAADDATESGTEIASKASIFFDENAPIDTNVFVNTIDSKRPSSTVAPLPEFSGGLFEVSWSGVDDAGGSGVASWDIFVSKDEGAFEPFLLATTATSAPFRAELESGYRFFSVATDNAGNKELIPGEFQGSTFATVNVDDGTAPISEVSADRFAISHNFDVSVIATDFVGEGDQAASGIKRIDVFVAIDEGGFSLHTSLQADETSFTFNGDSNRIYWFRSVAVDNAGNVEDKPQSPETVVFVGDFDSPETSVSSVATADNGQLTLTLTGTDSGGSELEAFDVFVTIDGGATTLIATLDAGQLGSAGAHSLTTDFQALTDGTEHTYEFFTVGRDTVGNEEAVPASSDQTVTGSFNSPVTVEATGIDVQNGTRQRSFVRFVDIDFSSADGLQNLIDTGAISLERFDLATADVTEGTGQQVDVSNAVFAAVNNTIRLDFGIQGIGGNRNSNAGDGFYRILMDLDGDGQPDQTFEFFRVFGDADGDGDGDRTDILEVLGGVRSRSSSLEFDMNGDGSLNTLDILFSSRESRLGKLLREDLFDLLDD